MKKKLVIVESPAKAKTINKYLGAQYQVEASMGHIRDLPKTQLGVDVEHNFDPTYTVLERAKKTVTKLKKAAKDTDAIYLAPDPDREGEAISWHLKHLLEDAKAKYKIYRVTFNEITKSAIQKAFEHPRDIDMSLVDSQQARRVLDRIVGYQISPLLWKNVAKGLSAGRVQSVAVRLIVEREVEIENFKPVEYWQIKALLESMESKNKGKIFVAKLDKVDNKKIEVSSKRMAEDACAEIKKGPFVVSKIDERQKKRNPQAPYTTSKLQQESFTRLRFSAQKTMSVAQKLYEGVELGKEGAVGLITYMRTDSVNVSPASQQEAREYILEKFGKDYLPESAPVYKSKKSAQEAHEAIRPSMPSRDPESVRPYLEDDAFKLYDLIWRKFMASQMVPAVDNVISIDIAAADRYMFRASGTRNLFKGFLACYSEEVETPEGDEAEEKKAKGAKSSAEEKESQELPKLKEKEVLRLEELLSSQHFTKPPPRFNDASLVKTLEELGIGRPSTYAPTIQTIIARLYVERKSSALQPTDMGKVGTQLLVKHFESVMDYKFTASMEEELDKIEEGKEKWTHVLESFYRPFKKQLDAATDQMKSVKKQVKETEHICSVCGKGMVIKWGRFGQFLACSGFPDCKHTAAIPTGVKCPEKGCDGDLVKRAGKNRRTFFGCSKYPACRHISNKLPNKDEESQDGQPSPEKIVE